MTKHITVVCDNTMGIPGKEIDDGLAILYLLGQEDVHIDAICTTHGNATTEEATMATTRLCADFGLDVALLRGADAGSTAASDAARFLVEQSHRETPGALLSLGATTDLAAAERLEPGCLARFECVALMGGITHTLIVGGRIMNELNFTVDAQATCDTFAAARLGARILLADAHHCLPLVFYTPEFTSRLVTPGLRLSSVLEELCLPWFDRARREWNTDGFVGWDVLAAIAAVHPELVDFEPFDVACNLRLFEVGYLEAARDSSIAAPLSLVAIRDVAQLVEHVYQSWERAAR